jgi:hypothetical protein
VPRVTPESNASATAILQRLEGTALTLYWAHREPPIDILPEPPEVAPSDSMQRAMNLVMPLRWTHVAGRAELAKGLSDATAQVLAGLNNLGTVHFARFDIIDRNLCMFSIYDGDLRGYIRDFIASIGPAFDMLMAFVKHPPPPVQTHPDQFIDWVADHDAFQFPEVPTDLARDLTSLQRESLVEMHRKRNVQLGLYRNYPGFSASQIREHLGVGW